MPDKKKPGKLFSVLMIGDIVGKSGCRAIFLHLKTLKKEHKIDFVIANGENAADGFGLTPQCMDDFFKSGVDVITSGNHIWHKSEIFANHYSSLPFLRPANYPQGNPGRGYCLLEQPDGPKVGVINLQGRECMRALDCPFRKADELVKRLRQTTALIFIDFHAEAPQEKQALAHYLAGRVSAVVGTHTHVQTSDETILKNHTAYLTDLGMTGPRHSVIGFEVEAARQRAINNVPIKMTPSENPSLISGALLKVCPSTGAAFSIDRISVKAKI